MLNHIVVRRGLPDRLLAVLLFLLFLALYIRTAAPSVLSGDSAEFQMAAPLLGVPHPTTYPLYVLLGKLATLVIPFGDLAWRVTIVSAVCAALAVALFFGIARRLIASAPAGLVGALALGLAPGLWNAATMAEVYALMMSLLVALLYLIVTDDRPRTTDQGPTTKDERPRTTDQGPTTKDQRPRTNDQGPTKDQRPRTKDDRRRYLPISNSHPPTPIRTGGYGWRRWLAGWASRITASS